MNENNPNLKLLTISVIYSLFTVAIWLLVKSNESASLGYMFFLFIGWIIFGIITGIIIYKDKIKLKNWNLLLFLFCTPIPFLVFFKMTSKEPVIGTWEYNKNEHRIREITYENRKEYSSSVDKTTEEYPIPANEKYHLDSIVHYDENNNIIKIERFK
ncbi:hypothetical protein [Flavobacterium sp. TSSA_36]|uniref:hypothetical protein n=1 Tax=Flavobacterium sp. TSSA_36 TaxID=3447669 RepID=UPI003F396C90